jgi:hypothetical protein
LCAEDFLPTDEDILHARVRTTGISDNVFQIGDHAYHVYDVGGERSERKKWIKVFDAVSLIFFFVPMSGYNEPLYEDMNGVSDSIRVPILRILRGIDGFAEQGG